VPIGAEAITPSVPDSKYKPGEGGQYKCKQMPFSGFAKDPTGNVK